MYEKNYVLGRHALGAVTDDMPTPAPTVTEELKSVALGGSAKAAGIGALLGYFIGKKKIIYALVGGAIGFFGGSFLKRGIMPAAGAGVSPIQAVVDALNSINPENFMFASEVEIVRTGTDATTWEAALISLEESNEDQFYALQLNELSV